MGRLHPFRMANRSFALTSTQAGYLMYSIRLRRCKSDFPTCLISPSVIIFLGDRGLEKARSTTAFPEILAGRLPRVDLLRPAQRSLTFRPAYSLNRPRRSVTPKASTDSLSPRPLRLLSTGATVAGWELHPLEIAGFHGVQYMYHTRLSLTSAIIQTSRNNPITSPMDVAGSIGQN